MPRGSPLLDNNSRHTHHEDELGQRTTYYDGGLGSPTSTDISRHTFYENLHEQVVAPISPETNPTRRIERGRYTSEQQLSYTKLTRHLALQLLWSDSTLAAFRSVLEIAHMHQRQTRATAVFHN